MQTFLPYDDYWECARVLDYKRLGKQRVEAYQILNVLTVNKGSRWRNHPAVRMWRGHEQSLLWYAEIMCAEWTIFRGYRDSIQGRLESEHGNLWAQEFHNPPWLVNPDLHLSHQSNLVRKAPEFYIPIFGNLESVPYLWPV